jgi:hypothetical protein
MLKFIELHMQVLTCELFIAANWSNKLTQGNPPAHIDSFTDEIRSQLMC